MRYLLFALLVLFASCKTTSYFVVRHAEKAPATSMVTDVPLSEAGKERAMALKERLINEHVRYIYSTNYDRTRSTAMPLSDATGIPVEIYNPDDTGFVTNIKMLRGGNVLIVGHSNTVDNIVNELCGRTCVTADLTDIDYGDLFIVKKKGKRCSFERQHFGK